MLNVQLLRPEAKAPNVAHPGEDLGYDLYAAEDVELVPGRVTKVSTGIAVELNPWFGALIRDRSSLASQGIVTSGGVIDAGYRGEIIVLMTYLNPNACSGHACATGKYSPLVAMKSYQIKTGDKIAQLIPYPALTGGTIAVVETLSKGKRGARGFGSTGK